MVAKLAKPRKPRGLGRVKRNGQRWAYSAPTEREALLALLEGAESVLTTAEIVAINDTITELGQQGPLGRTGEENRQAWLLADLGTRGPMPLKKRATWVDHLTGKRVHVYLEDGHPPRAHVSKKCKCRYCSAWRKM